MALHLLSAPHYFHELCFHDFLFLFTTGRNEWSVSSSLCLIRDVFTLLFCIRFLFFLGKLNSVYTIPNETPETVQCWQNRSLIWFYFLFLLLFSLCTFCCLLIAFSWATSLPTIFSTNSIKLHNDSFSSRSIQDISSFLQGFLSKTVGLFYGY